MPRKPAKSKKKVREGVGESALSYFFWNGTLWGNTWAKDKTEEEIYQFYLKHKEQILNWYIEKNRSRNGEPGKRPAVFWKELELAGHTRRKTGKTTWCGPVRYDGGDRTITEYNFESDFQFLKRLDLLADWEQKQCRENHES